MPALPDPGAVPEGAQERKLESWGEIAAYLRREIRTVQRWEKTLGLPIRRLNVGRNSSVYAYPSELDKWYREREPRDIKDEDPPDDPALPIPVSPVPAFDGVRVPSAFPAPAIDAKQPDEISSNKKKYTWIGGTAFVVILVLFVARAIHLPPFLTAQPKEPAAADGKIRLFVRPLQTIAGDASQSEFADGLTSELITRLGGLDPKHLGVIAPTSSKQLGGKPISELEPLLKLNYVLEGTVRHENENIRIDLSLISAKEQTPLWSDHYNEKLSHILKVQDEVAESVAQKLLLDLPSEIPSDSASVDPAGYTAYLRGRRFWALRDLAHSVPAFEDAVRKMPQYVPAHSGLAASYAVMGEAPNDAMPPSVSSAKAKAEVQRALALDQANAEAHYVLGNVLMYCDWDFPAAEAQLREAVRLEPNNATAHQWLAQYFMMQKRAAEAQAETDKALELDPVSPIFTTARAEAFYFSHNFDAAIAQANLTLEQSPNFILAEFWLASAYREKKMYKEALQHFRKAASLAPNNPALLMALGHTVAVSGDKTAALAVLADLQALSKHRYVPVVYYAGIYLGLGDTNQAFAWLDRGVTEHDDRLIYLAVEPMADPLRSDPRFQALLTRIHLDNGKH
jgi:TolB-like protein/Flp pilus assembly protein TadD